MATINKLSAISANENIKKTNLISHTASPNANSYKESQKDIAQDSAQMAHNTIEALVSQCERLEVDKKLKNHLKKQTA